MAIRKTTGQKRKKLLRIVSFIFFVAAVSGISKLDQANKHKELSWINDHQSASAVVQDLREEEEQYRTLKGRHRTRTNYYIGYSFDLNNKTYSNNMEISSSQYEALYGQEVIDVWYKTGDPETNLPKFKAEYEQNNNTMASSVISMAPVTAIGTLVLYFLIGIFYVRESKDEMPEGFYTENSWLDIDDNYLVYLDNQELVILDINEKQSMKVQEAYQNSAAFSDLLALAHPKKVKRISLNNVSDVSTSHTSDKLELKHGEEDISVEFLNRAVKNHAFERIKLLLSSKLVSSEKQVTRKDLLVRSVVIYGVASGLLYYFDTLWVLIPTALIAALMIPSTIRSLIDPPLNQRWTLAEGDTLETT